MATGDLELPEDEAEKQRLEEQRQAYAALCALMKEVLGDKVEKACTPVTYLAQVEVTCWPVPMLMKEVLYEKRGRVSLLSLGWGD